MPHNLLYDSLYSSDGLWMSTLNLIFLPRSSNLPWFYQAGNLVLIDSSFCFLLPFSHQIPSILFYKASCLSLSIPTAIKLFGALMTSCHHCLHSLLKVPASGCFPIPCIHSVPKQVSSFGEGKSKLMFTANLGSGFLPYVWNCIQFSPERVLLNKGINSAEFCNKEKY